MGFYSLEAIEKAVDRSKDILIPFDFLNWTRLAVIMIFLGGTGFTGLFFNIPFSTFTTQPGEYYGTGTQTAFDSALNSQISTYFETALPAIGLTGVAIIGVLTALALFFLYLNSLAQFVMFRGIRDREIQIRKNIGSHYIDAAKYFLFQILLGALVALLVITWGGSFFLNPLAGIVLTLAAIPVGVLIAVFFGLVHDFVPQKMIEEELGFFDSLKQVVSVLRTEWRETGVCLIVRLFISSAVALMALTVVGSVSVVFLLVFGIISGLIALISPVVAILPAALGVLLWMISILYLAVPFRTYMYSYFVEVYENFSFNS